MHCLAANPRADHLGLLIIFSRTYTSQITNCLSDLPVCFNVGPRHFSHLKVDRRSDNTHTQLSECIPLPPPPLPPQNKSTPSLPSSSPSSSHTTFVMMTITIIMYPILILTAAKERCHHVSYLHSNSCQREVSSCILSSF